MGVINQALAFALILLILASVGTCLQRHQKKFVVIDNEKIKESVEIASSISKEMEIVLDALPENDLVSTCDIILNSSSIIGNLLVLNSDHFIPEDNEVLKELNNKTELLVNKINEMSVQTKSVTDGVYYVSEDNTFPNKVLSLQHLMGNISLFLKERSPDAVKNLNQTCKEFSVTSFFTIMKTLLDTNEIMNQLKNYDYNDSSFTWINSVYTTLMKQLLIAFPICETLKYDKIDRGTEYEKLSEDIVKFVAEIEENLKKENEKRKRLFQNQMNIDREVKNLRYQVEWFKQQDGSGWELETIYGISQCGENFAIVVTEVVRVAVRLFTQKEDNICAVYHEGISKGGWLKESHFWTRAGASQVAREWKDSLQIGRYQTVLDY